MEIHLDKVFEFAKKAHGDQRRKYRDELYIQHPVRVMETCKKYSNDVVLLSAALLHDVLEDTDTSEEEMKDFLLSVYEESTALEILIIVKELTDVYTKKDFPHLNRKQRKQKEVKRLAATGAKAQTIKYADIIDNSNDIADAEDDFAPKLLDEYRRLLEKIDKGNPELYSKVRESLSQAQSKISDQH